MTEITITISIVLYRTAMWTVRIINFREVAKICLLQESAIMQFEWYVRFGERAD